jgi:hypothetical protein
VGTTWLDVFFAVAPPWLAKLVMFVAPPVIAVWCVTVMVLVLVALWKYVSPPRE